MMRGSWLAGDNYSLASVESHGCGAVNVNHGVDLAVLYKAGRCLLSALRYVL